MKKPFYKRWSFWIIVVLVLGVIGIFTDNKEDKTAKNDSMKVEEKAKKETPEKVKEANEVEKGKKEEKLKSKINLTGDYQFSGMANIKPTKATIKNKQMTFTFDWRNDGGTADERSFEGSGVTVIAYQNGKELEQLDEKLSGDSQRIKKNTTLEINYKYKLIGTTPITIEMLPLEGTTQKFTFKLTV